ncbi:MAG: aminotransferase class V-fold PLP-dependent enzyme [Christensenellales bacterium]|jgi:cysteine desulfurase/selenocysteine lyase
MSEYKDGLLFSEELQKEVKEKFYYVDEDPDIGKRLFFDNAGGAFRLKSAVKAFAEIDAIPDCPERIHKMALKLQKIQEEGTRDARIIFNAKSGAILTHLTASQAIFAMVQAVAENIPGTNIVTSVLEHPSAFDATQYYADKTGCALRVAQSNRETGGVDVESIVSLIDKDTMLLSCMFASNITGAIYDMQEIVRRAREVKPDLYIICDAVQHAPHGIIDLEKMPVDGVNFAPYKFFGCRGSGIGYVSDRLARLPHHKLSAKPDDEWELGSPAPTQYAVITAIVDYVCWLGGKFIKSDDRRTLYVEGMNRIKLQERALMAAMLNGAGGKEGLRGMKNVRVFLDYPDLSTRDFILAMGFDNLDYTQAVREYEKRNVIVYDRLATSLYSKRMLDSFGMDGAIRVSPLHCNDVADIVKFLTVTEELAAL